MCLSIAVNDPERILRTGKHRGLEWVIAKNSMGYRCGYVRVPQGHPCHGQGDGGCLDVHGGITFAEPDVACEKPGDDTAWWLGFDCAHAWDLPDPELSPLAQKYLDVFDDLGPPASIKDTDFVQRECESLCEQLEKMK